MQISKESLAAVLLMKSKGLVLPVPDQVKKEVFIIEFAYNREATLLTNERVDRKTIEEVKKFFQLGSESDLKRYLEEKYQMVGFRESGEFYLKTRKEKKE